MRSVLFGLLQAVGAVAALAGLYLLTGLALTLLVGGTMLCAAALLAEILATAGPRTTELED